jgi:hypothetical protein
MANFFDQFDEAPKTGNFFDQFDEKATAPKEESGFLRQVADVPLSIGRGAATGVRMIADAFGAGSEASEAIKGVEGYLSSLMSAQAKNDEQEVARIMKDAEDKGVLDQVKAGFKAFSVAPVDLISQGLGTAAPAIIGMLGGKLLGAGALGMSAISTGIGAGMGAGSAKGGIYEEVKAALKEANVDEAKAEQVAIQAQKYGGKNMDQILLSAGLGGLAGRFGLESSAKRMLTGAVGKETGKGAAREIAEGATRTAVTESVPELLQGSQEQMAKNIALQREGFDVPTMRGVAGSGTLEALAGAGLGAVTGGTEAGLRRQARGEADRILAEEEKARADAEQARLDAEEQARTPPPEMGAESAPLPSSLQEPVPEPYVKPPSISGTKPEVLLGGREEPFSEREDPLAGVVAERRAAAEPKSEVPLVDDYAFLQRERQRLLQQEQTPELKKLVGRIDEQLATILKRDIERLRTDAATAKERERADAEAAKTSVFAQEELPPVERRGAVLAERDLTELQAKEGSPELTDFELQQAKKTARMAGRPSDESTEFLSKQQQMQKDMKALEAKRNKIKTGGNLYKTLEGQLDPSEVSDIAPDIKKLYGKGYRPLANPAGQGTFISELVEDGLLNDYLPSAMRPDSESFDAQASAEFLKRKLRTKNTKSEVSNEDTTEIDTQIEQLQRSMDEFGKPEISVAEVEPGEAASIERSATEQDVGEATDIRYQRSTTGGKSIGKQQTQSVVDAIKSQWSNAPEVVVAESMDDPAIPEAVRAHNKEAIAKGAKGSPKGFFYKGKAYILADSMTSSSDAMETLFHESLGHYGLRGTFGPEMGKVLADVVKNRRADVEAKAKQYGLDVNSEKDMLEAAEEVLAEMAQTKPGLSFVKRAISVIRNFLRDLGLPFKMSNEDIIQKYILPARAFVEKGASRPSLGGVGTSLDKPSMDGLKRNSKAITDFLESHSRQPKPDRLINIPSAVMSHVLDVVNNEQVFRSVVRSIPVDVMDFLSGKKLSPKNVLSNKSVLENMFSVNREPSVSLGVDKSIAAALMRSVAISAAKVSGLTGGANKDGVASFARKGDAIFGAQDGLSSDVADTKDVSRNPNFLKWFGDSKVVNENGKPLVVYHGTFVRPMRGEEMMGDIKAFDRMFSTKFRRPSIDTVGSWFSTNPGDGGAEMYSGADAGSVIYPAYLSIKNPQVTTFQLMASRARKLQNGKDDGRQIGAQEVEAYRTWLKSMGKDGIKIEGSGNEGSTEFDNQVAWIALEPSQIKSATGNIGTYDPENADIRYQREAEAEPAKTNPTRQNIFGEPVLGTWSITVDPKMELQDGLIYKMLDKNIDVKRIIEAVKSTGKQIASKWNPYLQEELYHGRTASATKEFKDEEWVPFLEDMRDKGVTVGELEKYLLNRHAEEYNKLVAYRNPDRPDMQDGGSSVKTEDARKYLAGLNKDTKTKYEALAKRVDGITKGTRQLLADEGYEKASTIKSWEESFPNYVPLMREEADFDYNFSSFGTGRGFDVRRDFSRRAMGSKRNVVDILGNVISARNQAISLTEKNRVAQAVYGLALEAPNPDFWMAINPDLAEVREVDRIKQKIAKFMAKKSDPNITDEELDGVKSSLASEYKKLKLAQTKATEAIERVRKELVDLGIPEETISAVMQEPEQRILDEKNGRVVKRVNTKLRENDHVLATRINGEKRYVFFNPKDPRSKRAATALKNLDAQDLGTALGMIAKVTRWMASVNTQYNPIFGPYNFLRDIQAGALQLSTTELAGQQKEIAKYVIPSMGAIYSSLRKRRKGEKVDSEMAKLWKEFQSEGGQTGFRDNFSRTQDRTEALLDEMARLTEGKLKAGGRAVVDWLSDYNDSLENAVRLSAYKVAKEKFKKDGFSDAEAKQKAASLAKNLTVNFNRKGDVATQMGALYAFFNASMQGSARMVETLKGPMGKKIMGGGLLLGSMQALLLASAGFDDEEPPEFVRSKNFLIPTGNGNYVAFPQPLGFHVIPGISRILTEWAMSGFKDTARRVTDLTGLFLDAFNPIGNAGWSVQTITPTILDPFVALGENKDFTGKPISKEDMFSLNPTPGYSRAREGANFLTTALAEFLNAASGGDKDRQGVISPTPEQIEYLIGQATGGVGRELVKLTTTIDKTITGEDLPPYKIPLYGRFVGETKSAAAESNKFYKNMKELNELNNVVKGRRERREPLGDFYKENPEARLLPLANKTFKDVQALRKRRKALLERDAPRESIQAVEKMITRKMQVLNDRVRALEERN